MNNKKKTIKEWIIDGTARINFSVIVQASSAEEALALAEVGEYSDFDIIDHYDPEFLNVTLNN